jgi:hypothetical protein
LKFLVRVQGQLFLVVQDTKEKAIEAVKETFGDVVLLDLSELTSDFILEVDLLDMTNLKFMRVDKGEH